MLRPEIDRRVPFWSLVGAASGGALGFIIGNIPGLVSKVYPVLCVSYQALSAIWRFCRE